MAIDHSSSKLVKIKQEAAIMNVKENLYILGECIDNMPNIFNFVKLYGGSIIKAYSGSTSTNYIALSRALNNEESVSCFVQKYLSIIESLEERYRSMILNKYIRHKTSYDLQFGDDDISGHSRYYKILHEAYTQIAILDEKIDYTINDHLLSLKFENMQQSKAVNKIIVLLIRHNEIYYDKYLDYLIHALPDSLFKALDDYINNDYNTETTYQYQLVRRAIFTLALQHKEISYNLDDFYNDIKLTGSGWKKYYNSVLQLSLF